MAAENTAVSEHLVLRPMASGDPSALAAHRSDPVQARYQSWETPYPVDSAQALIAEIREVRFAQPGAWLQVAIETAGRLIGDVAVRVDAGDPRQAEVGFPELNPKADQGQPTLFDTHRFHAFFTTSDLDTVTADQTHRRHAIIEQINADLKDSALAHLPSGVFTANAAWLVLVTIAFNLSRAIGSIAGGDLGKARSGTIRRKLINIPARISTSARKITIHLPASWHWEAGWSATFTAACGPPNPAPT